MRCEVRKGKYDNQYFNYVFSIKSYRKCSRYGVCCKEGAKTHSITIVGETRQKQYNFEQTEYFKHRIKER